MYTIICIAFFFFLVLSFCWATACTSQKAIFVLLFDRWFIYLFIYFLFICSFFYYIDYTRKLMQSMYFISLLTNSRPIDCPLKVCTVLSLSFSFFCSVICPSDVQFLLWKKSSIPRFDFLHFAKSGTCPHILMTSIFCSLLCDVVKSFTRDRVNCSQNGHLKELNFEVTALPRHFISTVASATHYHGPRPAAKQSNGGRKGAS